jgi:hypothetical protein
MFLQGKKIRHLKFALDISLDVEISSVCLTVTSCLSLLGLVPGSPYCLVDKWISVTKEECHFLVPHSVEYLSVFQSRN